MLQGLPTNSLTGDEVLCTNMLDSSPSGSWFQPTFNILHLFFRRIFLPNTQHGGSSITSLHFTSGFSQRTDIEQKVTADTSAIKMPTLSIWFPGPSSSTVSTETSTAPSTGSGGGHHSLAMLFKTCVLITATRLYTLLNRASLLLLAFIYLRPIMEIVPVGH